MYLSKGCLVGCLLYLITAILYICLLQVFLCCLGIYASWSFAASAVSSDIYYLFVYFGYLITLGEFMVYDIFAMSTSCCGLVYQSMQVFKICNI